MSERGEQGIQGERGERGFRGKGSGVLPAILGAYCVAAVSLLLLLGVANKANNAEDIAKLTRQAIAQREAERKDRTKAFCEYAYNEKRNERRDAIKGYRDLPRFAEFFAGDPQKLQEAARTNLIKNLHGRYGNHRLPDYCPQSKLPEHVPKDLRRTGT